MISDKWEENLKKEEEELQEYEKYIQDLHDPFTFFKQASTNHKLFEVDNPEIGEYDK